MTSTEVKAQTTSGTDWASICNTVSAALVSSCDKYVNGDGTLATEGDRAYGCIRNGVLMAGGALEIGVPAPIIIGGLRVLAGQTGCDNIVNWDLVTRGDLQLKALFEPHNITFANKETVLEMNGCTIVAYPSNHLDAYRALDNPKFIMLDNADFFRKSEQEDVRHVSERYIGKSDPYIVMVSTRNAPDGLFEKIEKEPEETCIYKRLKLDYTHGLDKIYTRQEIEKAKQSPSFGREYDLKYLGLIGNAFHQLDIDAAITNVYDPTDHHSISTFYGRSMGLDPGYGSSPFAIVISQFRDGYVEVLFAEEYDRPLQNETIERIIRLNNKHHIGRMLADANNAGFVASLKQRIGDFDYKSYVQNDRVIKNILEA